MRNRVGVILFLALASGLLAAYLAFRFLRQPTVSNVAVASELSTVGVMVAARDLEMGHLIEPQDVRPIDWPAGALPEGFARSSEDVVGRGLIAPVRMNEPFLASKIANVESGAGLPLGLKTGMRAVAVRVNEVIGVAGWISNGQRVDVLVTFDQSAQFTEPVTQIVLQDIEILRMGQITETNDQNEAVIVTVATLAVTPEEAEKLTLMETKGTIRLSLRNPLDRDTVETQGIRAQELINGRRVVRTTGGGTRIVRPTAVSVEIISGTAKTTTEVQNSGSGGGGGNK